MCNKTERPTSRTIDRSAANLYLVLYDVVNAAVVDGVVVVAANDGGGVVAGLVVAFAAVVV